MKTAPTSREVREKELATEVGGRKDEGHPGTDFGSRDASPKMVFCRCCSTCDAGTPPDGYSFEVWRPGLRPPGAGGAVFFVWWAFHRLRVFRNREYSVIIVRCGSEVVHRSCVFPGYFRFPFMATADVQIGDTWTSPKHRRKGLATWALMYGRETLATGGRRIWYVAREDNVASVRAAEKAGFSLVGRGSKKPRLGSLALGYYDLEESSKRGWR